MDASQKVASARAGMFAKVAKPTTAETTVRAGTTAAGGRKKSRDTSNSRDASNSKNFGNSIICTHFFQSYTGCFKKFSSNFLV